jgi:hypothetical protein
MSENDSRELPKEFEEYPELKQIARNRNFDGKLTVFLTWFIGWNSLFQFGTAIFIVVLVKTTSISPNAGQNIKNILTFPNAIISAKVMQHRMYRKAKERWRIKYES